MTFLIFLVLACLVVVFLFLRALGLLAGEFWRWIGVVGLLIVSGYAGWGLIDTYNRLKRITGGK